MKTRKTNLVNEAFIGLDEFVIHRVIMRRERSERVSHIVDTEKYSEQAIGCSPGDFGVVDIGMQKLMFNLVFEALHSRSKARHHDRVVNGGSTVG